MLAVIKIDENAMEHGRDWSGECLDGWAVMEKLDGSRGYWDGRDLWTRSGRRVAVPSQWLEELPAIALEGEVWAGRGGFQQTRQALGFGRWSAGLEFRVFDAPAAAGGWRERLEVANSALSGSTIAGAVSWDVCPSIEWLGERFLEVKDLGGEGLIARQLSADPYTAGRSRRILKLKTWAA